MLHRLRRTAASGRTPAAPLVLALCALCLSTAALADSPYTSALAATNNGCSDSHNAPGPTSASISCGTGVGSANSDYGALGATSGTGNFGSGHGIAGFVDYVVDTGGTGQGTLSFNVSLDGSVTATSGGSAETILFGAVNQDIYFGPGTFHDVFGSGDVSFTFGQPFQLTEGLIVGTSVTHSTDTASAEFSAMLVPDSWVVRNANGQPLPGVSVIGESEHVYVPAVPGKRPANPS